MDSSVRRRPGAFSLNHAARIAGICLAFGAMTACAPTRPTRPAALRVPPELLPFLEEPTDSCVPDGAVLPEILAAHRRLLADADGPRAEAIARVRLESDARDGAARALLGQALLVAGRAREAVDASAFPVDALSSCAALALARGRALESLGEVAAAYTTYRGASGAAATAARRAAEISDAAQADARDRFGRALGKSHLDSAGWYLELLELWWPRSESALRARLDYAARTGDRERELAALRALHEARADDRELTLRRAELELEAGEARTGLALIERLAADSPSDPELRLALDRARFEWRLQNAPEPVRRARRLEELSRADFAVLVYWMAPPVRTARPAGGKIASDVLDHAAREEIVRMVNLGLMSVDESLHRFSPAAPMRRFEAIRALLRLVRFLAPETPCLAAGEGREAICSAAASCGLVGEPASCLSSTPLSGRDAVELLRAALAAAGAA